MKSSTVRILFLACVVQQCFCFLLNNLQKIYLLLILNIELSKNNKTQGFYNIFTMIGIIEHKIIGEIN